MVSMGIDGSPVKRFLSFGGGLWIKSTEGDRVHAPEDPYESGNERAMNVAPIANVPELRGGYSEEEGELGPP